MNTDEPVIGLTMGDPVGIGPELIVKAWSELEIDESARFIVIGAPSYLERACQIFGYDRQIVELQRIEQIHQTQRTSIACLAPDVDLPPDLPPGQADRSAGRAARCYIESACDMALARSIDAIVTLPINKAALLMAGGGFPGHTEILAGRCGVNDFAMMLYVPDESDNRDGIGLGVVHTTLHQSLRSALDDLSVTKILSMCKLAHEFADSLLRIRGIERPPRIAVAAVNPHAGEHGIFGREEIEVIAPAISAAQELGIPCSGPVPCDTLMARAVDGEFDMVVAMYHDQGHIALKLLGMHRAVNVTLGLPIIRTSVAHGTAFDIAGTGKADTGSLLKAIDVAQMLISHSRRRVV